jgi:SnoaL-like domain
MQELLDIENIKRLKARYFRLLDHKAWDDLEHLFTDEFTYLSTSAAGVVPDKPVDMTPKGFVARLTALTDGCTTNHHGHMPEIEIDGDNAHGIWAMQCVVKHPTDAGKCFAGFGHDYDDYERGRDGIWRVRRSTMVRRFDPLPLREADVVAGARSVAPGTEVTDR